MLASTPTCRWLPASPLTPSSVVKPLIEFFLDGDYKNLCPKTFVDGGFTLLQSFSAGGQKGYVAKIPEMKKVRPAALLHQISAENVCADRYRLQG